MTGYQQFEEKALRKVGFTRIFLQPVSSLITRLDGSGAPTPGTSGVHLASKL
jgi:hypothetical protein